MKEDKAPTGANDYTCCDKSEDTLENETGEHVPAGCTAKSREFKKDKGTIFFFSDLTQEKIKQF